MANLITDVVRQGIQTIPAEQGLLYEKVVGGVERELIRQVLQIDHDVLVRAAARLGINRNTLHKKVTEFDQSGL